MTGDILRLGWTYTTRDVLIAEYCLRMRQSKGKVVVCHHQHNQCIFVKDGINLAASMECALDVTSSIQRVVIDGVSERLMIPN